MRAQTNKKVSKMANLSSLVKSSFKKVIETSLEKYKCYNYRGRVIAIGDGIAEVAGLYKVQSGEMVEFSPSKIIGMACGLRSLTGCLNSEISSMEGARSESVNEKQRPPQNPLESSPPIRE